MWIRVIQLIIQSPEAREAPKAPDKNTEAAAIWGCVIAFVALWAVVKSATNMTPGASFVTTVVLVVAGFFGICYWLENK